MENEKEKETEKTVETVLKETIEEFKAFKKQAEKEKEELKAKHAEELKKILLDCKDEEERQKNGDKTPAQIVAESVNKRFTR